MDAMVGSVCCDLFGVAERLWRVVTLEWVSYDECGVLRGMGKS